VRVMGIDLGIAKIAYSLWENDRLVETNSVSVEMMGKRALQLTTLMDYIAAQVLHFRPDHVVIEDVLIGNNRKYSIKLAQTMGAVLAGLGRLTEYGWYGETIPVNVGKWKKEVIGNGHAGKEDIRNYLLERDSAYAELCGSDQDRFDAACIGYYGVILSERANRLADAR